MVMKNDGTLLHTLAQRDTAAEHGRLIEFPR